MSGQAQTPGQAAYEAMHASREARRGEFDGGHVPWPDLDESMGRDFGALKREDMEAAAIAGHEVIAARQPQPAPGVVTPAVARPVFGSTLILAVPPGADEDDVQRLREHLTASAPDDHVTVVAVRGVEALRTWEPQPAPELAAAMAETRKTGTVLAHVLSWFNPLRPGWAKWDASVTRAQLARAYRDGGLTVPEELRRYL